MVIHVDSREKSKIPYLLGRFKVPIEIKKLEVGDYIIIGPEYTVCVESKSAQDFLGSIKNGQLNSELLNMSNSYDYCVLLIHGNITDAFIHAKKVKRRTWFEYLAGCVINVSPIGKQSKISVITVDTVHDAVSFLRTVHKKISLNDIYREPSAQKAKIPDDKITLFTTKYMFPPECKIGNKRAQELLEEFGSIKGIVEATKDQIMNIDGFGEKLADSIISHINRIYENDGDQITTLW